MGKVWDVDKTRLSSRFMASAKLEELERFLAEAGLQPAAVARALVVLQAVL